MRRQEAEGREAAASEAKRLKIARGIRRSPVMREPLVGGLFQSEYDGTVDRTEMARTAFARELRFRDAVWPPMPFVNHKVNCMFVDGSDEKSGLGVAYLGMSTSPILYPLDEKRPAFSSPTVSSLPI